MKLLNSISIGGEKGKTIELYQGDLTSLAPNEAVDLLIVSAFPGDYIPTPSSLIGALDRKGLSVASLAKDKDLDLRKNFSCWLSKEFTPTDPGLRFRRILCFEPRIRGEPPELVGDIFRSLAPILGDKEDLSTAAMPLVAAGDQGYSVPTMLVPLLDAAIHWMEVGLPLKVLKIVTYFDEQAQDAASIFAEVEASYKTSSPQPPTKTEYDVFISYAHENEKEMGIIEDELNQRYPTLRVFLDRKDIDIGTPWQPQIFETLDRCRKVVVLFSTPYLESKVCKEEFNIAWARSRESDENIIFPIYLYSADLPTYMKYRNYIDCREGNEDKLRSACSRLYSSLEHA